MEENIPPDLSRIKKNATHERLNAKKKKKAILRIITRRTTAVMNVKGAVRRRAVNTTKQSVRTPQDVRKFMKRINKKSCKIR